MGFPLEIRSKVPSHSASHRWVSPRFNFRYPLYFLQNCLDLALAPLASIPHGELAGLCGDMPCALMPRTRGCSCRLFWKQYKNSKMAPQLEATSEVCLLALPCRPPCHRASERSGACISSLHRLSEDNP